MLIFKEGGLLWQSGVRYVMGVGRQLIIFRYIALQQVDCGILLSVLLEFIGCVIRSGHGYFVCIRGIGMGSTPLQYGILSLCV